jgi:hypothetical protein
MLRRTEIRYASRKSIHEKEKQVVVLEATPKDINKEFDRVVKARDELAAKFDNAAPEERHAGLGLTYERATAYLAQFFAMESSTPVGGQDRYMGKNANGMAMLELIGPKSNLVGASLVFAVPGDAPNAVIQNSVLMVRFLKNTFPEWEECSAWVVDATRCASTHGDRRTVLKNNKRLTVQGLKPLAMICVSVKPGNAEDRI